MIMQKISYMGQEVYKPMTMEEALNCEHPEDLIFTSEDEKMDYQDALFAKMEENTLSRANDTNCSEADSEDIEAVREEDVEDTEDGDDADDDDAEEDKEEEDAGEAEGDDNSNASFEGSMYDFAGLLNGAIRGALKDASKAVSEGIKIVKEVLNPETWFTDDTAKPHSRTADILKILPFMDKKDLDVLIDDILSGQEEYADLDIASILPFCSKEACDRIFMNALHGGKFQDHLYRMLPFVSSECLGALVDEYISGRFQDLKFDALYPFLASEDIKKIFDYIIHQKKY